MIYIFATSQQSKVLCVCLQSQKSTKTISKWETVHIRIKRQQYLEVLHNDFNLRHLVHLYNQTIQPDTILLHPPSRSIHPRSRCSRRHIPTAIQLPNLIHNQRRRHQHRQNPTLRNRHLRTPKTQFQRPSTRMAILRLQRRPSSRCHWRDYFAR